MKDFPYEFKKANQFETNQSIQFKSDENSQQVTLKISDLNAEVIDHVIVLEVKK